MKDSVPASRITLCGQRFQACDSASVILMIDHGMGLIPEPAKRNDGSGIRLMPWMSGIGRFNILGCSLMFWPAFVQHEGCIFRRDLDAATYQDWMKSLNGDTAKVEAMVNRVHIADLFLSSGYQPDRSLLLHFGQVLKEMWSCKLARDFPGRSFEIELRSDSHNALDVQLTFFQRSRV